MANFWVPNYVGIAEGYTPSYGTVTLSNGSGYKQRPFIHMLPVTMRYAKKWAWALALGVRVKGNEQRVVDLLRGQCVNAG